MGSDLIKYLYIVIIIALLITLIVFFIKFVKLMKKAAGLNEKLEKVNKNKALVDSKTEYIKSTKNSWQFFFIIYVVLLVLSETFKDYKKTEKSKKNVTKSFGKTCVKNVSKIKKIRI